MDAHRTSGRKEFASSLQRATQQLAVGAAHEAANWAQKFAQEAQQKAIAKHQNRLQRRIEEKFARQERKIARRIAQHQEKMERTSALEGYGYVFVATVLAAMALINRNVWWLVFVAFAFGMNGLQIIGYHRKNLPAPPVPEPKPAIPQATEPRDTRIDEICDRLKAALKDAPQSVRDFLSKPEETVEALRKTSQDLFKKERALRSLANDSETERLARERASLQARIDRESDEIVRQRLTGALAALDHQRTQYAEVSKSANRLEAERTRLGYTLDGLYAQVMRLRTADAGSGDLVDTGLRMSLDQLRDEMNALAEAVEQVNRAPVPPTFEAPEVFDGGPGGKSGERVR